MTSVTGPTESASPDERQLQTGEEANPSWDCNQTNQKCRSASPVRHNEGGGDRVVPGGVQLIPLANGC
ncbi:uncharacterized protein N7482_008521 [Penicillium canariense]|uniref:Uncharacterized protein n=1 Tax=Penicillium canariense TaxID=189055 RepID=A0A9W9LHK5_9EURO|nr:uncharacterized protein N7482_008521 [Penicillium canariense]KAJ5157421.1 hypothetical protein N7482_008521 [Penicillium canariense]